MFLPHDAEEIMKIKVPTHEIEDTLAWHYEKMAFSQSGVHTGWLSPYATNSQLPAVMPQMVRAVCGRISGQQTSLIKFAFSVGVLPVIIFQLKKINGEER
jgi:hypothetical protein